MSRLFRTAQKLHRVLRAFPGLRQRIDSVCVEYHEIQENFNYDLNSNGERWLLEKLASRSLLKNVFDVGANRGDWTKLVLAANPAATMHCFEICQPTFQKLTASLAAADKTNVFLNPYGLSESPGKIKIKYCPTGDGGTTMFDLVLPLDFEIMEAKVDSGKNYCVQHGVKKIDCLKIDVEGAGHLVLRGFEDMLNPADVPVVQFEYNIINILTKFLLRDYYAFFESRGYKVGKLFPESVRFREYRFLDEDFRGPNYVAASPQIAPLLTTKRKTE